MTEQEERIWAEIQKKKQAETREKILGIMAQCLLMFTVGIFIFSPCQQLIMRFIGGKNSDRWYNLSKDIREYQDMIQKVNYLAVFTAVLCYIYFIYRIIASRGKPHPPMKERLCRLSPLFLFWAFAILIPVVTVIRGHNEYDLTGHPYMFESIYSYMLYPTCYFFCGAMIWQSRSKKSLIYLLLFSSMPLNIISLYDEWVKPVEIYLGRGVAAVFHNSNHYGYYLAITIIAGGLMAVYEKRLWLKAVSAVSAVIATMVLIINNTLGAYIAVAFAFFLFIIYSFFISKQYRWQSLAVMGVFLLITFFMSFRYNTVMSSFVVLFHDVGKIASDPLEADSAGSSRWKLWKGTVKNIHESPWTGFGVEGLLNTHYVGTPHNEVLQYMEFFGIPAALLYVAACASVLLIVLKNCKSMDYTTMICFFVSIGYLTSSMFGVAIYYTTPYIYIFLGLTYAEHLHRGFTAADEMQKSTTAG
ncbi:MAG: O-antigen ligase family protein [Ruminococcus sp.]|nr:O-antigen ligase family protein [Ruminococcus sp.]